MRGHSIFWFDAAMCYPFVMGRADLQNYYEILEVPQHASQADITSAYQRAQQTFSNDNPNLHQVFTPTEAEAWRGILDEAFQVIGHPQSREIYNQELSHVRRIVPADLSQFELESKPQEQQVVGVPNLPPSLDPEEQLPSGYGRTPISTFEIQNTMEDYIKKEEIFDGLFLKKIRIYKNVDPQAFSAKTCIALRHIYAIENNNFSVLPASVFVRGYVQQYCRILNLEEERVVPSFMSLLANEKQPSN